jgi:long-subunit fatty acid transport protein
MRYYYTLLFAILAAACIAAVVNAQTASPWSAPTDTLSWADNEPAAVLAELEAAIALLDKADAEAAIGRVDAAVTAWREQQIRSKFGADVEIEIVDGKTVITLPNSIEAAP